MIDLEKVGELELHLKFMIRNVTLATDNLLNPQICFVRDSNV